MRCDDDLSEGDGRRTFLQIGATTLKRGAYIFLRDVHRPGRLFQLAKCFLLQILAAVLLDQSLSVFLGRAKPCLTKLVTIFLIGSELRSELLDLLVGRRGDIALS